MAPYVCEETIWMSKDLGKQKQLFYKSRMFQSARRDLKTMAMLFNSTVLKVGTGQRNDP